MELASRVVKKKGRKHGEGEVEFEAGKEGGSEEEMRRKLEWKESVMGLVGCLERLGRGGRAKQWRRKLEDEEERGRLTQSGPAVDTAQGSEATNGPE